MNIENSGTKAINLTALKNHGFNVPQFYIIPHKQLANHSSKTTQKLAHEFANWKEQNGIRSVAIRSSAIGEDGVDKSFAGQFETTLNVRKVEDFMIAIQKIAKSTPKSGYTNQKNFKINIIIQEMVEPDYAGVLFTVNPANGLAEMTINARSGLGDKVVNGEEVSIYHINRWNDDVITDKSNLLSQRLIEKLYQAGIAIEQLFGTPQDIEWAIRENSLYILQARNITKINNLKAWDNSNIGESFPGIVLPLTYSIARRGYELVYKSQSNMSGLGWHKIEENHYVFHNMIGTFNGRMYYNLASWYRFIALFPNNSQNQKFLDDQIATMGDAVYRPPSYYSNFRKIKYYTKTLWRIVWFNYEKNQFWKALDIAFDKYNTLPNGNNLELLFDRYRFVEQKIVIEMGRSADNDFMVMTYHGLLKKFLKKHLKETDLTTNFLGSLSDVTSARQAEILLEIARFIKSDEELLDYLSKKQYQDLDDYLLNSKVGSELREYREHFIHRFAGDQKIEAKNPLLELDGFYEIIKTYTKLNDIAIEKRQTSMSEKDRKRDQAIKNKLSLYQQMTYSWLLKRLKHHLRIREKNRLLRGKGYALMRELFPQIGEVLTDKKIIESNDDVFYLDIDELMRLVDGTNYLDDYKSLILGRKKTYRRYQNQTPEVRFVTTDNQNTAPLIDETTDKNSQANTLSLPGTLSSPGNVTGKVIILHEPIIPKEPFDILVTSHTDPGWTPLIALAKGVIIEHGGLLSHAAIVTRELGIPSIIGVKGATTTLKDNMQVRINANKSSVEIIEDAR